MDAFWCIALPNITTRLVAPTALHVPLHLQFFTKLTLKLTKHVINGHKSARWRRPRRDGVSFVVLPRLASPIEVWRHTASHIVDPTTPPIAFQTNFQPNITSNQKHKDGFRN